MSEPQSDPFDTLLNHLENEGGEGMSVQIDEDGGVTLTPIIRHKASGDDAPENFYRNLADDIPSVDGIADQIVNAVDQDEQARSEWMSNYRKGMELLGLRIEEIVGTKANKRNVSSITHPLLLESVVRAQGQARAELLPAAGPVKVRIAGDSNAQLDDLARSLEQDMNLYLTVGAPEYYPDTDRGLFQVFFSGNWFRKVYFDPLRRRPVCQSIDVDDLIVPINTVDLDTALRVTHKVEMSQPMMKRMMAFGDWRQLNLGEPTGVDLEENTGHTMFGPRTANMRVEDRPYIVYEVHLDIDPEDMGWHERGAPANVPLPYVITIERDSRQVLSIRRNWRPGDDRFIKRQMFVHYGMIPAFEFLCLGYVHLLGNSTRALTSAWRLLCDAGMFANFPGGMKIKGIRLGTNEIAPSPGEWFDIDGNGIDDIRKIVMPMPYKDPSPVFINLLEIISRDSRQLAGTVLQETGEGRTNIPVGTIMAMVEQATQVSAVVHKRLHAAQAREFQLLKEVVSENPESIVRVIPQPDRRWLGKLEFDSVNLVPASDPNVPSQTHRVMLATAIVEVAARNPDIYNRYAAHMRAWRTLGISDAAEFMHFPMPNPEAANPLAAAPMMAAQAQMLKAHADMQKIQAEVEDSRRKAAAEAVELEFQKQKAAIDAQLKQMELAARQRESVVDFQKELAKLANVQRSANHGQTGPQNGTGSPAS